MAIVLLGLPFYFSSKDSLSNWDIIIVGAGAAGLMAAASASSRGRRVLLLEKNKKLGVKVLMSGGTRCNITHNCSVREIVSAFGKQGRFLHSALSALPPLDVIKKIEGQGVATKIESTGKIFPVSNKAIDVRDALVRLAEHAGATIRNEHPVEAIEHEVDDYSSDPENQSTSNDPHRSPTSHPFTVRARGETFRCKSLIITTGGKSYPGCGTTGDGYSWAEQFGHSIVSTVPALVPILNDCQWANDLKGITIEHTNINVWQPAIEPPADVELSKSDKKKLKAKSLAEREGSFLFTHWGFSGPSVLDVSREVARHPDRKSLELVCDFRPELSEAQFQDFLQTKKTQQGKQIAGNLLNDFFPRRLSEALLTSAQIDLQMRNAELSKNALASIATQVKRCQFEIKGTLGFEKAEVTAGGVQLKEVDSKTMQSKTTKGLYFAGEVLDLDGPIGGFNFQSAFSTGWLAGMWA